jgi:hypothetical protein
VAELFEPSQPRLTSDPSPAKLLGWVADRVQGRAGITILAVLFLTVVGGLLRLVAALTLTPHVDEASSLLAAHAVAERGLPILPSGTVYFQGATLSYLLAPLIWLGFGDLSDLSFLRLVIVVAGMATIWLSFRLGATLTGRASVGAVMATLVALDPLSIQWSGHLRMYGLLQAITIALALGWMLVLTRGASWPRMVATVLLFWAAVFTHAGATLLGPAMFIAALVVYRRSLVRQWRVLATLAASAIGPVLLMILNRVLGSASVGDRQQESSSRGLSFVGDNLLAPLAISPDEWDWMALTRSGNLFWLVPGVLVAIATIAGGRHLLRHRAPMARTGAIVVLAMYWFPVVTVGLFTNSPKERYLLNSHLLGYLFAAVIVVIVVDRWRGSREGASGLRPAFAWAFSIAIVATLTIGVAWRFQHPVVHPDHHAAMAYVAEHHQPGQPVIIALPAVGYLAMDEEDHDDLHFLAGEQDQSRARRYTRTTTDGRLIDYWVGAHAMVDPERLRTFLGQHPDAWVVVDRERLTADWAYGGVVEDVLRESTTPIATTSGGGLVLRPANLPARDNDRLWSMVIDDT